MTTSSSSSSTPDDIKQQQRDRWNKSSGAWRSWDALTMKMLKPAADAMLAQIAWRDGLQILDVASGTGEPGLTAASMAPTSRVLSTDLSEEMTGIAGETARQRGLTNFRVEVASADRIPAPDNSFDVVLCRFGFMFFPDIAAAVGELKRVLKPGGRVVAAVWGAPPKNAWATTIMSVIRANVELPEPPPDAPGLFRFADASPLARTFTHAGLRDLQVGGIEWLAEYGSPHNYWSFMTEVPAPIVEALAKATPGVRERIEAATLKTAASHVSHGEVRLSCGAHILSAIK